MILRFQSIPLIVPLHKMTRSHGILYPLLHLARYLVLTIAALLDPSDHHRASQMVSSGYLHDIITSQPPKQPLTQPSGNLAGLYGSHVNLLPLVQRQQDFFDSLFPQQRQIHGESGGSSNQALIHGHGFKYQ